MNEGVREKMLLRSCCESGLGKVWLPWGVRLWILSTVGAVMKKSQMLFPISISVAMAWQKAD